MYNYIQAQAEFCAFCRAIEEWRTTMIVSYEKLWRLLQKNKMKKKDLAAAAGVSEYAMTKLNKGETVSMDVMVKFCKIFHCNIGDIMDVIEEE